MMTSVSDLTRNENKIYHRCDLYIVLRSNMHLQSIYFAVLHWGGFTTQWGNKSRINGADEKYTICLFVHYFFLAMLWWWIQSDYTGNRLYDHISI